MSEAFAVFAIVLGTGILCGTLSVVIWNAIAGVVGKSKGWRR